MPSIDEPVHIVEYCDSWPLAFAAESESLRKEITSPGLYVKHIGSTAVPGLASKPVIDIMLGIVAFPPPDSVMQTFSRLGYESLGEAGVRERLYFRRRGSPSFNVHVVEKGGKHWAQNLALRDYLRLNAEARARYAEAKRSIIESGADTLLAYSEAKVPTISAMLSEALALVK